MAGKSIFNYNKVNTNVPSFQFESEHIRTAAGEKFMLWKCCEDEPDASVSLWDKELKWQLKPAYRKENLNNKINSL